MFFKVFVRSIILINTFSHYEFTVVSLILRIVYVVFFKSGLTLAFSLKFWSTRELKLLINC